MSGFNFFNEMVCQLCKYGFGFGKLFYLTDCLHPFCEFCIEMHVEDDSDPSLLGNKCQILDCQKELSMSKKKLLKKADFSMKLKQTLRRFVSFDSEKLERVFFLRGVFRQNRLFFSRILCTINGRSPMKQMNLRTFFQIADRVSRK